LIALLALAGIGAAAIPVTFWSMIPDTVEYSELTTGIRAEGFWFGMVALAQKIALGVGVGLVGVSLDWASYVAEGVQSAATLKSMQLIMTVPSLGDAQQDWRAKPTRHLSKSICLCAV
jgi:GPH family glycoside/pentoside/hexuronide:cation symporter